MVNKIEQIHYIIELYTDYTGEISRLSEINPNKKSNDFIILDAFNTFNNNLQHHCKYKILLKATTQTLLETMVKDFLQLSSNNPNGYTGDTSLQEVKICADDTEDVEYTYDEVLETWTKVSATGNTLNVFNTSDIPPSSIGNMAILRFPFNLNTVLTLESLYLYVYTVDELIDADGSYLEALAYLDAYPDPDSIAADPKYDSYVII